MAVYAKAQDEALARRKAAEAAAQSRAARDKASAAEAQSVLDANRARVAALKASVEATLGPWRAARDERPGLKWRPTPKPVFVSYAADGGANIQT